MSEVHSIPGRFSIRLARKLKYYFTLEHLPLTTEFMGMAVTGKDSGLFQCHVLEVRRPEAADQLGNLTLSYQRRPSHLPDISGGEIR